MSIETLRNDSADKIKELLTCNSKNKLKSVKFNSLNTLGSQVIESKLSDNTDDILPATQIQALNHKVISSKERKGARDVTDLSDNLEANKALIPNKKGKKETSPINSSTSQESLSARPGIHTNSKLDFDDLPPTQVCNNSIPNHGKAFEPCSLTREKSPKKTQNSENNILKKKSCAQNSLNLQESHSEAYENHVKVSKRLLGCQNFEKELRETKNNSTNLAKKQKKESDECTNKQINCLDLKLTIKKEKTESSECRTTEDKVMFEKTNNVEVKQEKMDFEFLKPNLQIFDMNKSASATSNNIKIKSEIPCDDSLPATQAVNIDPIEEDSLPATQAVSFHQAEVNSHIGSSFNRIEGSPAASCTFLPSSKIKSEVIDDTDDDITIIECVAPSDARKKDEIVISIDDDESEDTVPHSDAKEEASVLEIENCAVSSKSQAVTKTSVSMQREEKSNSKLHSSSKENKEKYHSDSAKLKHYKNNSKPVASVKLKLDEQVTGKTDKNKNLDLSEKDIKKKTKHKEQITGKADKNKNLDLSESDTKKKTKYKEDKSESKSSKSDQKNPKEPLLDKKEKKHHSDSNKLESSKEKCKGSGQKHRDSSEGKRKEKASSNSKSESKEIHSKELTRRKNKDNLDSKCIQSDLKPYHNKDLCFEKDIEKANLESRLKKSESKQTHKKDLSTEKCKEKFKGESKESDSRDLSAKKRKETMSVDSKDSKRLKRDTKQNNFKESSTKEKKSVKASQSNSIPVDVKNVSKATNHISKPMLFEEHSKDLNNDRRCSSEKENSEVSYSDKHSKKEICITLKPINKKRSHDIIEENNKTKKTKYNPSVDSESCSSDDVCSLKSDIFTGMNSNSGINSGFDLLSDGMSTPCSDTGLENINVLNKKSTKESYSMPKTDLKKISFKDDLKEEIENEVKLVLKPFFSTGLITKDDYKDIMRRAVPKIFKNCHNCINPEKIRKLVLSYVSLISKS